MRLITFFSIILILLSPLYCLAQRPTNTDSAINYEPSNQLEVSEETFKAKIIEVDNAPTAIDDTGQIVIYQNIKLKILNGPRSGEELLFNGIDRQITTKQQYKTGQVVHASYSKIGEQESVNILDVWRVNSIYYILAIFLFVVLIVGKSKGLRSILSLIFTFLIIFKVSLPLIISGYNPILITLVSAIFIIFISMLLIYGFNKKATTAMISITLSVIVALAIASLFIKISGMTGLAQEESLFLSDIFTQQEKFSGLLLAAFVLGSLGILDDVVLTQISAVEQLKVTDPKQSNFEIYKKAMKIGTDHIASMINTLFLAYAGAAFFLLFLIQTKTPPFNNILNTLNNEIVATEIVRTFSGSIGLILAIPLSTYIACYYFYKK